MADFRKRPPHELARLSDRALVAYIDEAREAGNSAAVRDAAGYLAFSFEPQIRARVVAAIPREAVDDVVMEVHASLIRSGFEGKLVAQFGALVRTITQRRIADYHRAREGDPDFEPLAWEHGDEEEVFGGEPSSGDETPLVDFLDAVERALERRNPLHQKVIRLYGAGVPGFEDLSAAAVCERLAAEGESMSVDNVAKIWSRFKRDLEDDLDG